MSLLGSDTKGQGSVVLVTAVRPVSPVCVVRRRFAMTSRMAHQYMSNLEKAVQAAVREFWTLDSKQATATSSNTSCIPLV